MKPVMMARFVCTRRVRVSGFEVQITCVAYMTCSCLCKCVCTCIMYMERSVRERLEGNILKRTVNCGATLQWNGRLHTALSHSIVTMSMSRVHKSRITVSVCQLKNVPAAFGLYYSLSFAEIFPGRDREMH